MIPAPVPAPGPIILLGSGETAPNMQKVYTWLFERVAPPVRVAILETPAGFELNSPWVAGQIGRYLEHRLQNFAPQVTVVPARKRGTPFSPDEPGIVAPLHDANVIVAGPGSPTYAVRQLCDSLAWHTLCARHRLGAALIFASAVTLAASAMTLPVYEIYKVGEELHWKCGLDFFRPFGLPLIVVSHWNNSDGGDALDTSRCYMGRSRFEQLLPLLPGGPEAYTVVGIDERTALVLDLARASARVMGVGGVTLLRHGREEHFAHGAAFPLTELGPFALPAPGAGIRPAVWQAVREASGAEVAQGSAPPEVPAAVAALVEERQAARARKDWAASDRLRDAIAAQGWRVSDTPDGPVLEQSAGV
jgi:hypothetical protein